MVELTLRQQFWKTTTNNVYSEFKMFISQSLAQAVWWYVLCNEKKKVSIGNDSAIL